MGGASSQLSEAQKNELITKLDETYKLAKLKYIEHPDSEFQAAKHVEL